MPASGSCSFHIKAAGQRFHANDNISEFIRDGETRRKLQAESAKMRMSSESFISSAESDHNTQDTAKTSPNVPQRSVPQPVTLRSRRSEFPNVEHLNEADDRWIPGHSACSHHLCPSWAAFGS